LSKNEPLVLIKRVKTKHKRELEKLILLREQTRKRILIFHTMDVSFIADVSLLYYHVIFFVLNLEF